MKSKKTQKKSSIIPLAKELYGINETIAEQGPILAPGPAGLDAGQPAVSQCSADMEDSFLYWQGIDYSNIWQIFETPYPYSADSENNLCGIYCGPAFALENIGTPESAWWSGFPNSGPGNPTNPDSAVDFDQFMYNIMYEPYGMQHYCECCLPGTIPTTQQGNPDHINDPSERPMIPTPRASAVFKKLQSIVKNAPKPKSSTLKRKNITQPKLKEGKNQIKKMIKSLKENRLLNKIKNRLKANKSILGEQIKPNMGIANPYPNPVKKTGRPNVSPVNANEIGPATPIKGYDCVPAMYQGEPNPNWWGINFPNAEDFPYPGPPIYDYGNSFIDTPSCRPIFDVPGNAGYQPHYSSQAECIASNAPGMCRPPEMVDNSRRKPRK